MNRSASSDVLPSTSSTSTAVIPARPPHGRNTADMEREGGVQLQLDNEGAPPPSAEMFTDDSLCDRSFPRFDEIRSAGRLCDVTLVCGEARFFAHRVVLAATVPYFRAMFCNDMIERDQREITMQGIEPDILEALVNFAYTGRVQITLDNVQALHIGAAFLQLSCICNACGDFLKRRLSVQNVLTIRCYAHVVGSVSLVAATDAFINKHFLSIRQTSDFSALDIDSVLTIIGRDELYVPSEEPIFETAIAWVQTDEGGRAQHMAQLLSQVRLPLLKPQYITDRVASEELIKVGGGWVQTDESSRAQHMAQLLSQVRLPLLKPQYITDRVASEELIKNCLLCRDLVDEAKDYHLMPERRPLLQSFRTKARCCSDLPGVIYAVGGLTTGSESLSTVEIYDPVVARWNSIEPMQTLRSRVGVAVMNRRLYAIGGFNGHERLRTVEVYDPDARAWSSVAQLNTKRSALGAAVVGDALFVCGGYDGISSLSSVEVYDHSTDRWCQSTPMTKQRSAAGIAVLDGRIYVMGGHDGMSIFNSVECFDLESEQWTSIKHMNSRRCRLGATTLNGKIYVAGGYDGSAFLRSVECYDPSRDEWTEMPTMNVKRSRVALVATLGRLYAIGGYDGVSNLSSIEIYTPKEAPEQSEWVFGAHMIAHEGGVGIGVVPTLPFDE